MSNSQPVAVVVQNHCACNRFEHYIKLEQLVWNTRNYTSIVRQGRMAGDVKLRFSTKFNICTWAVNKPLATMLYWALINNMLDGHRSASTSILAQP